MSQLPYCIRLCIQLFAFILIVFILVEGQVIFVPLYLSVLISILLLPIVNFLERCSIPRSIASLITVIITFSIIILLLFVLSAQIITFFNDVPAIKKNLTMRYETIQSLIKNNLYISFYEQQTLLKSNSADVQSTGLVYLKETFFTLTQSLAFVIFIIIYCFLILYYRSTIKSFLMVLFSKQNQKSKEDIIYSSKKILKSYMSGLLIEMVIISISNSILLLSLGIKYAIFLGVFTGLLNILPFIGIYTGILFTVLISLITDAGMGQIMWMVIGLLAIHFVDANFIMPRIVGAKVKINALMTILGAVAGGLLMGLGGVFLALPTIAILKILFDRIEGMEAWAILLGDESSSPANKIIRTINTKLALKKKMKI